MKLRTLVLGLVTVCCASAFAGEGWITSYADAAKISKKTGKPILADFTGSDWCGWCKKLHAEVFSKPAFQAWAKKNVVLLTVDFPQATPQSAKEKAQNQKLQEKYQVEGFPTILLLGADGKVLGRSGYAPGGAEPWVKEADKFVASYKKGSK